MTWGSRPMSAQRTCVDVWMDFLITRAMIALDCLAECGKPQFGIISTYLPGRQLFHISLGNECLQYLQMQASVLNTCGGGHA